MNPDVKVTFIGEEFLFWNWYYSNKSNVMRRIKEQAVKFGYDEFICHFRDGTTEHYERHGTRWFKL